jgi:c-di-GMP-binding flagellar brake protein YcgR
MINNRQYDRYPIKCNGEISVDSHQNYKFIMNDISAGGMNITTDREMKEENPLTIQLDGSQIPLPHTKQLHGVIVRKDGDNTSFNYGIRFIDLSNMEITEIDQYLRDMHFTSLVNMVDNPKK